MSEHPYGWLSLLPPLVAIALAVATRRVVTSLLAGVLVGALILARGNLFAAIPNALQLHLWGTLVDEGRLHVFAFTTLMGSMAGIINRSGGMRGLVDVLSRWAHNRCRGQLTTWLLGLLVFFDDYANTVLLGSTLRPLTDRLRISREKLAYLVDSTAAPVAGLALVSTWVAIEIDFIQTGLDDLPLDEQWNAFAVFLWSIPYRFYAIWALIFVMLVGWTGRDFGPMAAAERSALRGQGISGAPIQIRDPTAPHQSTPTRWYNAIVPLGVTVALIIWLLYATGRSSIGEDEPATLIAVFGAADAYGALLWGALCGTLLAGGMSWCQRLLKLNEITAAAGAGARIVFPALAILWLASALSSMTGNSATAEDDRRATTASTIAEALASAGLPATRIRDALRQRTFSEDEIQSALVAAGVEQQIGQSPYQYSEYRLYTGEYLGSLLRHRIWVPLLPTVVFVLAALVAFATGTSWGTMGILMPLTIPLAHSFLDGTETPLTQTNPIFLCSVASVLAGSIFGDHCSPISDTTVLSSQASGCDHVAHVWTQLPYALVVALVAVLVGTVPVGMGISVWVLLPVGALCLFAWLVGFGKNVEQEHDGAVAG